MLVLIGSLGSSLLQPIAGLFGDRVRLPWLAPLGLVLAAAGLAGAALGEHYALVAIALALGGVGVAIFHPEAVRSAVGAAGESPGASLGFFATGGNAGFALGPALVTPAALALGLAGVSLVAVVPLAAAGLLLVVHQRARRAGRSTQGKPAHSDAPDDWRLFGLAVGAAIARTGYMFGLMAFVPAWFRDDLDSSVGLGSAAITAMLVAGALGTYAGGRLGDRHGRRTVIVWSLALTAPVAVALPFCGPWGAVPLLVVLGLVMDANFYPLVLEAQEALPRRIGFASGMSIGLSVGAGAGCAALLGLVADGASLTASLHACAGLAVLALVLAVAARARPAPAAQPLAA